jgi:hypothetical protein
MTCAAPAKSPTPRPPERYAVIRPGGFRRRTARASSTDLPDTISEHFNRPANRPGQQETL